MTRFRLINWWISHKFENLRFFFTGGGILVCLAGIFGEMPFLAKGGAEFLLVVFLVILIHENLRRFWLYLENHQESCRLPTEQMKRVNAFLLGCFLAVFLGLTVFFGVFPWEEAGRILWHGIRAFLRWLGSMIPESQPEEIVETSSAGEGFSPEIYLGEGGEPHPFWEAASVVAASALAAGFGFWLLRLCYYKLAEYLGNLRFDGDVKEFIHPEEERESAERGRKRKGKRRGFFPSQSSEEKIRRLYRSCILEGLRMQKKGKDWEKRTLPVLTPEQMEGEAGVLNQEFHRLYEKARYSPQGTDTGEAVRMKEECSKIRRSLKAGQQNPEG